MRKVFCLILTFVSILLISNNVFAEQHEYATVQCGTEYWTPYNDCRSSSDNATITKGAVVLDYVGDGKIELKKVHDNAFNTDPNFDGYEEVQYITADEKENIYKTADGDFAYVYDLTALANYYKKSNSIPKNIVVSSYQPKGSETNFNIGNVVYFYFGAS